MSRFQPLIWSLIFFTLVGWVEAPRLEQERRQVHEEERRRQEVIDLRRALEDLRGDPAEADQIAQTVSQGMEDLRRRYGMVRPSLFHNLLVNLGLKNEGYCWHWTRDLTERLKTLPLKHYHLHWAVAREGRFFEHNAVVVTAQDAFFTQGLVIDGWRKSGRLFWTRVAGDRYPWREKR